MGEISDSLINGEFDFYTGEYIGKPCGYPRTFSKSLPWERKSTSRYDWKKVTRFMIQWHIPQHLHPQVVKDYGCKYTKRRKLKAACSEILKDFEKFKKFVVKNIQKYQHDGRKENMGGIPPIT